MKLTIGRRILRLVDPRGERERMQMREWRSIAEANADDLTRTMTMHGKDIAKMIANERLKK